MVKSEEDDEYDDEEDAEFESDFSIPEIQIVGNNNMLLRKKTTARFNYLQI